jgi:hypothetical protein
VRLGFVFFPRRLEGERGVWKLKSELEESPISASMSTTLPVVLVLGGVEVYQRSRHLPPDHHRSLLRVTELGFMSSRSEIEFGVVCKDKKTTRGCGTKYCGFRVDWSLRVVTIPAISESWKVWQPIIVCDSASP